MSDTGAVRLLQSSSLLVFVLLLAGCQPAADEAASAPAPSPPAAESDAHAKTDDGPHWSYSGDNGPENWATLDPSFAVCGSGAEQSPVDLAELEGADLPDLEMTYLPTPLAILHDGHTVKVAAQGGGTLNVGDGVFTLSQFHFHSPSEHTVEGRSFPLEMHLVHADDAGNLAVVGVLFEEGDADPALAPLADNLPQPHSETAVEGATIDIAALLPKDLTYVGFAGSLTTPPCMEGVAWHVLTSARPASAEQLQQFKAAIPGTNRPIQALGDRVLKKDVS